jgi:hypothetical protein
MFKTVHCAVLLGVFLVACTAGLATTSGSSIPQQQAEVTSPTSGLQVTASIVSVTLGEECGNASGSKGAPSADCAPTRPADAGTEGGGGGFAPGEGGCGGSYCQQSNVQIAFNAGAGSQAARVQIVSVQLIDAAGSVVDTLTASKPQLWNGAGYSPWDETVKPAASSKTSYDLTAPSWSKMDGNRTAYAAKYKLHVTLLIDGVQITLESANLSREPSVAT